MSTETRFLLPAQPTLLVDRTHELAVIYEQLVSGDTRLLNLIGPAGVGKTRLALAAAACLADHFRDGVVFVDLTSIREPELVLSALLGTVSLMNIDTGSQSLLAHLQDALGERQVLLVLDNFEQVLPAGTLLSKLLAARVNLRLLVTSRAPLQLRWEQTLRISPLPVPDLNSPLPPLDELAEIPSIKLFLQQMRARQADFVLTEKQAPLVARLAAELDGLPLALELAAARIATLSLPAMAHHLGDRLRLLHWEASDVPARQQSLEGAVGWSYDLLSEPDQRIFRCLGVFVGRACLDAIATVSGNVAGKVGARDRVHMLDKLLSLVEQSLIQPAPPAVLDWPDDQTDDEEGDVDEGPAFGVLKTVRAYARERLAAAGELETARRAHAHYFLALAERAEPLLRGPAQHRWLLRLDREHDNLRSALCWLLDQDNAAERLMALRLAGALGYFWQLGGYHAEGGRWLEEALDRAPHGEETDQAVHMRALLSAGVLRAFRGELPAARIHLAEALTLARQLQDDASSVRSLVYLGVAPLLAGQAPDGPLLEEALRVAQALGEPEYIALTLSYQGVSLRAQGNTSSAVGCFTEALEQLKAAGDLRMAGDVHFQLGTLLGQQGDWVSALHHLRSGLTISVRLQSRCLLSQGAWAVLAMLADHAEMGARAHLLGAAEALGRTIGVGSAARKQIAADPGEPELREQLGQEEWAAAYRQGCALSAGEVATLTLQTLDAFARTRSPTAATKEAEASRNSAQMQSARQDSAPCGGHLLTERERAVLRLVEQGLSNKEIGRQLFISSRTVSQHLTSVFNKLGVNTRAQAVGLAAHGGLI